MVANRRLVEVEELALQLTVDEQLELVARLAANVRKYSALNSTRKPVSLKDKYRSPATDAISAEDIDKTLKEIRSEWLTNLEETDKEPGE